MMNQYLLVAIFILVSFPGISQKIDKSIPGANPMEIYRFLDNAEFICQRKESNGVFTWSNWDTTDGIDYMVTTTSARKTSVDSIATIHSKMPQRAGEGIIFFQLVASVRYDGFDPLASSIWIERNINVDAAELRLGNARMTIRAPNEYFRSLKIEPAVE